MTTEKELSSLLYRFTESSNELSIDDFYHQVHSTIELYISQNSNLGKQRCSEFAHTLFEKAIKSININSLLTSLIIFEYLNETPPVIQNDLITKPIIAKAEQIFDHIHFIMSVPDWAPYSDKECMEKIEVAAQSKNHISIARELQPFYNGSAFENFEKNIAAIIIKWIWTVDKKKIIDYLNENDWSFKMEQILFLLKENAKDIIQQTLSSNSKYPAIRAMSFFVESLEKIDLQSEPNEHILACCELTRDFINSYNIELVDLKYLLGILNSYNFNYLAGLSTAIYKEFLQLYLQLIKDLSDNAREAFSSGYLKKVNVKNIASDSWIVMNYWRDFRISSHDVVNKYNGLEQLLILGLSVSFSSRELYLKKLKETAIKIVVTQFEWNEHVLQKDLYLMFCLTLANKRTKHIFSEKELLQEVPILFDKRYEIKFGNYIFDFMRQMLTNSNEVHEVIFKNSINNKDRILPFLAID